MKKYPFALLEKLGRNGAYFADDNVYIIGDSGRGKHGVGNPHPLVPPSERQYDGWNMETYGEPWVLA
jgi:hypothetical protein